MNRFATCGDPRAEKGQRIAKMTTDQMIDCFKSAPMGSRHQRMLWTAQMLLVALIEAERQLDPQEFKDCA
jgi:hypothetical protein